MSQWVTADFSFAATLLSRECAIHFDQLELQLAEHCEEES